MTNYIPETIKLIRLDDSTEFDIPADVRWVEEHQTVNIAQTVEHTIGGSAVINNGILLGGIPFTLESREGVWFDNDQVNALVSESRSNPGGKYTIVLPSGVTKYLCWRQEPAVSFDPVFDVRVKNTETRFTGTLQFFEELQP